MQENTDTNTVPPTVATLGAAMVERLERIAATRALLESLRPEMEAAAQAHMDRVMADENGGDPVVHRVVRLYTTINAFTHQLAELYAEQSADLTQIALLYTDAVTQIQESGAAVAIPVNPRLPYGAGTPHPN